MAYGLIGSLSRTARNAATSKRRELPADMPVEEELIPPPMPTSMASGMQRMGGGLIGGGAPRMPTQPMAQMQAPAPVMQGGQTRTREQAKQAGLIGSSAPKGLWDEVSSDPFTFFLSGTDGLDRKYGRAAEQEQKQRFESSLDTLQLSPQDRVRAEMDPEGFFRGMNEANTANMKPQTDTFYDPVAKQWMRKPPGPMAVAKGTDLVDPETRQPIYSNEADPEPIKYGFENFDGSVWAVNPSDPTDRRRMGAAPAGTPASVDQYRPATPQELQTWGIPAGAAVKINMRTGEPQIISGAKPATEFSATEIRGFRDKADGLIILKDAVQQYVDAVKETSPKLIADPWDQAGVQKLKSAHGLITSAIKQADALGALDQGVQNLVNAIIADPVGFGTFGKDANSIEEGAKQLYSSIDFKLSRVPENYRFGSTGELPPEAPAQPNPTYFSQQAQRMAQMGGGAPAMPGQRPPASQPMVDQPPAGIDPEDWKFMDDSQKALFR